MIERKSSNLGKKVLHGLTIVGIALGSVAGAVVVAKDRVAAGVGPFAVTPFHEVLKDGQLSDRFWNETSMWSPVVDNPQFEIKVADEPFDRNNIPPLLNLETTVTVEGEADICARDYPPSGECRPIIGTDVSNYPFYTSALSPDTYFRVGSTSLEIRKGPGSYTEIMELTDPKTQGLIASANATLNVPKITRLYVPLFLNGEMPKYRGIFPIETPNLDHKSYLPDVREDTFLGLLNNHALLQEGRVASLPRRMRERSWQKRAA